MKMRKGIVQMRRRDDASTKLAGWWMAHSVGVRAEEIVEERGSQQAGHTYTQTDSWAASSLPGPGDLAWDWTGHFCLSLPLGRLGCAHRQTSRQHEGRKGRGREGSNELWPRDSGSNCCSFSWSARAVCVRGAGQYICPQNAL